MGFPTRTAKEMKSGRVACKNSFRLSRDPDRKGNGLYGRLRNRRSVSRRLGGADREVVDSVPGQIGPTPAFLIRRLVPSHQPPVTVAALTGFFYAHACSGTRWTFGPVLRVRAPGNSPAAGHPAGVGNETHDGSFDATGVGAAASHAAGGRTVLLENVIHH